MDTYMPSVLRVIRTVSRNQIRLTLDAYIIHENLVNQSISDISTTPFLYISVMPR